MITRTLDRKNDLPRKTKTPLPDSLVTGDKTGNVQLSEGELKDVSGGYQTGGSGHIKIEG